MSDQEITTDDNTNPQVDKQPEENENGEKNDKEITEGKKASCREKRWSCEDTPLWRIFMKSYLEQEKKLEKEDKFDRRTAPILPKFPNADDIPPLATFPCFPLNTFNLEERMRLPNKLNRSDKIRLWRNMKNDPSVDTSSFFTEVLPEVSRTDSKKWPGTWPCVKRDLAGEKRRLEKLQKRKRKRLLPCQEDTDSENNLDEPRDDFADHKELGHARVPISCPGVKKTLIVDRSSGQHPGLVDGDYIVFSFGSNDTDDDNDDDDDDEKNDEDNRAYADVCLRGLKGMHLAELSITRVREKTWKFCFYQAIVALLAKTQLRYKFAWSVNIDYIFDHAWMLFVHMGSINVKERIRLDDIVVYNYKYSVELELVHEIKDAPRITGVSWNYVEKDLKNMKKLKRPELMRTREEIGWEKPKIRKSSPVHEMTRKIEKWFDKLPDIYRNCVLRTTKFSLAFWKDGTFWYLFNPYRCDEFGLWRDEGYACIMKFCTKTSLRRHLMILLLRAYSYESQSSLKISRDRPKNPEENGDPKPEKSLDPDTEEMDDLNLEENVESEPNENGESEPNENGESEPNENGESEPNENGEPKPNENGEPKPNENGEPKPVESEAETEKTSIKSTDDSSENEIEENKTNDDFTVQIYQMIYHCVQIHNVKLLQRKPPDPRMERIRAKEMDDCGMDPLTSDDPCGRASFNENIENDDGEDRPEKPNWLKLYKVIWARFAFSKNQNGRQENKDEGKLRWHQFYVEEPRKIFSLWGEIHPTGQMFTKENRGKQINACYIVCAGMTRIQAPEYWSSKTLDAVIMCGDRYYTMSKAEYENIARKMQLYDIESRERYLGKYFKIGEILFEAELIPDICGRLYDRNGRNLWQTIEQMFLKYHFGILTCESSCLGIFKFCGAYYMIDVNSIGPPIFQYGDGVGYLIRASSYYEFTKILVLTIGSSECSRFSVNPIVINKMIDLGTTNNREKAGRKEFRRFKCPYDDDEKNSKKWKSKDQELKKPTIDRSSCKSPGCGN